MAEFILDIDEAAIEEEAFDDLDEIAEQIAEGARRGAMMHELKTDDPREGYVAERDEDGVPVVGTRYPLAHIDEFGSINNDPSGALRSAAAAAGRYVPDPGARNNPRRR
jgi:hypothetical protein